MSKLETLSDVTGTNSAAHNANNDRLTAAIENTLSRDGSSPNTMNANLDMNGYALVNVGSISRGSIDVPSYDDLRFPATAINPAGPASAPQADTSIPGLLFDASQTEVVHMIAQMPHAWATGTDLNPHLHWQKTTSASGNVLWRFEYRWCDIGDVMDAAWTTIDSYTTVSGTPDNNTAGEHLITSFGNIAATGKGISAMLLMRLSRVGGSSDDTYGADARLLEFDIHYAVDGLGSDGVWTKST